VKHLRSILFILSLAAIAYCLYLYKDDLRLLTRLSSFEIVLLLIPAWLSILLQSMQFQHLLLHIHQRSGFLLIAAITAVSTLYNSILPLNGGAAIRSVLLKKKLNINWSSIATVMAAYYIIGFLAMAFMLTISASVVYYLGVINGPTYLASIGFFLLLLIGTVVLLRVDFKLKPSGRIQDFMLRCIDGLKKIKGAVHLHFLVIWSQLLIVLITSVNLYFCFVFLDVDVEFWKVMLVQSFVMVSLVISITPGNIGIQEGTILLFTGFLSLSVETTLIATVLFRLTNVIAILISGLLAKVWLIKN
jgi:uncharacterized protein (TIRG00374 family)